MPFEIKASQIHDREVFEQAVAKHISRLKAFAFEKGSPRPVAHPLVEAAVSRVSYPRTSKKPDDFVADYVVIDDSPPPPPPLNLADRKNMLMAELRVAEIEAKEAVLPQRKHRLIIAQVNAANAKLVVKDGEIDDSALSDAEKAVIAFYKETTAKYATIDLVGAQGEYDIEELTEDTVDSWQLPQFG